MSFLSTLLIRPHAYNLPTLSPLPCTARSLSFSKTFDDGAASISEEARALCEASGYTLTYGALPGNPLECLQLVPIDTKRKELPFSIDFCSPRMTTRLKEFSSELVVKAAGKRRSDGAPSTVYDLTAGLGTNSTLTQRY